LLSAYTLYIPLLITAVALLYNYAIFK